MRQVLINSSKPRTRFAQRGELRITNDKSNFFRTLIFLLIGLASAFSQQGAAAGGGFPPAGPGGGQYIVDVFATPSPTSGQITITASAQYQDQLGGSSTVTISLMGLDVKKNGSTVDGSPGVGNPYTYTLPNSGDGDYVITVSPNNTGGVTANTTVTKDATPPSNLAVTGAPSNPGTNSSNTSLSVSATGMAAFKYKLKKNNDAWPSAWSAELTGSSFLVYNSNNQEYTQHVKVIARDAVGNWTAEANAVNVSYLVDRKAPANNIVPVLTWLDQGLNSGDSQKINVAYSLSSGATKVQVLRNGGTGTDNSPEYTSSGTYQDTGIYDSQVASYYLKFTDAVGNVIYSNSASATIPDRTAPSSSNNPSVSWLDQGANSADGQQVKVDFTLASGLTKVKVIRVSGTGTDDSGDYSSNGSYTDHAVSDNQSVSYYLRSYDAAGNWKNSGTVSASIGNRTAPAKPSSSWLSLTWSNESSRNTNDNQSVDAKVEFASQPFTIQSVKVVTVSGTGTNTSSLYNYSSHYDAFRGTFLVNYTDNGVSDLQTVQYAVRIYDTDGNYADSDPVSQALGDRTPPSNLEPVAYSWTNSASVNTGDNQTIRIGYEIPSGANYLKIISTGSGTDNGTNLTSGTQYDDTGVYDSQTVTYALQAYDNAGNYSSPSSTATISIGDRTAPAHPSMTGSITAGALNSSEGDVTLNWAAVAGASSYELWIFNGYTYEKFNIGNVTTFSSSGKYIFPTEAYAATLGDDSQSAIFNQNYTNNPNGNYQAHLPDNPNYVYLKTVNNNYDGYTKFFFRVRAFDSAGNHSDIWQTGYYPTLADRTPPSSNVSPSVTWLDQGDNSADGQKVTVSYALSTGAANVMVEAVSGSGTNSSGNYTASGSYQDTGVHDNQNVSYRLKFTDAAGNYSYSNTISAAVADRTAPISYTVNQDIINHQFRLSVSSSDGVNYNVTLKEDGSTIHTANNIPIANNYTYNLTSNKHYHAVVRVKDGAGNYLDRTTTALKNNVYELMDSLSYVYEDNSNRLKAVHDSVPANSFSSDYDTDASSSHFSYDNNGNTVKDLNRGINRIVYNRLNLPDSVFKTNGYQISYRYDGKGQRIEKKVKNASGTLITDRRYLRDLDGSILAELDGLNSKRVVYKTTRINGEDIGKEDYVYQGNSLSRKDQLIYLKDHLGNNRVVLKDKRLNYFDSFETGDHWAAEKSAANTHSNYHEIIEENGSKAHVLRNTAGTSILYKRLDVKANTQYKIKYRIKINKASEAYNCLYYFYWDNANGHGSYNYVSANTLLTGQWQEIETTMTTPQTGAAIGNGKYFNGSSMELALRIYSSAVTNSEVIFDDISVVEVGSGTASDYEIVATNDYFPFGQVMRSTSSASPDLDKFKYQGKERDSETGYDYFEHRYYDAGAPRFLQIDPHAERYYNMTPYMAMGNNPLFYGDPTGEDVKIRITKVKHAFKTGPMQTSGRLSQYTFSKRIQAPLYQAVMTNDAGSEFKFYLTRDAVAGRGAFKGSGEFFVRLRKDKTGEFDRLELYHEISKDDVAIAEEDDGRARYAIQIHKNRFYSLGCMMVEDMTKVINELFRQMAEDEMEGFGSEVTAILEAFKEDEEAVKTRKKFLEDLQKHEDREKALARQRAKASKAPDCNQGLTNTGWFVPSASFWYDGTHWSN